MKKAPSRWNYKGHVLFTFLGAQRSSAVSEHARQILHWLVLPLSADIKNHIQKEMAFRKHNTNFHGGSWTEKEKNDVWAKGRIIPNYSPAEWRWDAYGSVIKFSEHGNRDSDVGWEIDHIKPVSLYGSDHIDNLQPLNWNNNAAKGDSYPWSGPKK